MTPHWSTGPTSVGEQRDLTNRAAQLTSHSTAPIALSSVTYDASPRSIGMSLDGPQDVTVIAWWHTSFAPGTGKHLTGNPGRDCNFNGVTPETEETPDD